jgi:hypothetical protein
VVSLEIEPVRNASRLMTQNSKPRDSEAKTAINSIS